MVSAAAPEFRGSRSQILTVALFAAGLNLAAVSASFAGSEAIAGKAEPTQLSVWTDLDKPPFVLEDIDGRQVRLELGNGSITLVHFFATWCEPCRVEFPALDRLIARTDPSRFRVLAISVAEPHARIRRFIAEHSIGFQILLDRDRSVARDWKVSALPTTFILDRDLKPRLFVERDYDWDTFDVSRFAKTTAAETSTEAPASLTTTAIHTTSGFRGEQP